jgi:hypothetical protein
MTTHDPASKLISLVLPVRPQWPIHYIPFLLVYFLLIALIGRSIRGNEHAKDVIDGLDQPGHRRQGRYLTSKGGTVTTECEATMTK